ncbi:MAG: hypothetical protein EON54_05985 [Alcaligenaceae bacterium]|nr:MAG: hypothetical protein EON54_05985 [Alcaligenaceae bacterium]
MKIIQYFDRLNAEVQQIYASTVASEAPSIALVHAFVCDLKDFSQIIEDKGERELVQVVCSQFEASALEMSFGLYRQSFSSLRRAFETALAVLYFSLNKLEHYEWLRDAGDINWQSMIDPDSGALSVRGANALWPEILPQIQDVNRRSRNLYRTLSQYVHGNKETWDLSGLKISKNDFMISRYFEYAKEAEEILCVGFIVRYVEAWSQGKSDQAQALIERVSHISIIREKIGGPRDI